MMIRKIIKTIDETKELVKIRLTFWQEISKNIEKFQKRCERFKKKKMEFSKEELNLLYEIVREKRILQTQENLKILAIVVLEENTKKLLEINKLENKILKKIKGEIND